MADSLVVSGLVKRFGPILAVNDVSFSASRGDVLGFLGPNGAGKSTTMKIITGFLGATSGEVQVMGKKVPAGTQCEIGYLPENSPLYGEMTVSSFLSFIAGVRDLSKGAVDNVVDMLDLSSVLQQKIETLSKGYRRRVGLAQAIIHDPPVLVLDEPTDGLDPNQKRDVRRVIKEMSSRKTVIISTHILEEVSSVCNRVVVINKGCITVDSTPAELLSESKYCGAVFAKFKTVEKTDDFLTVPGVESTEVRDNGYHVMFTKEPYLVVDELRKRAADQLLSVSVSAGELDDVFWEYSNK